ncbi:MrpH family fimbial adhesin [Providencia heimbachae]|uniref:MrpH family fimbial adhesin n=1 Tax=Providencia heimbachae TaxID=333962 RepID=UPI000839656D|nr:adhesin [Providencia heimbachae]NIH24032.1 adhesin [Providencia heimbachae]
MKWLSYLSLACIATASLPASAAIFSYITEATGTPSNAQYAYVIERWDEENDGTPSPCYGWSRCFININHKHTATGNPGSVARSLVEVTGLKTMKEVRAAVLRVTNFPINGRTNHVGESLAKNQECVGLFYQSVSSGLVESSGRLLPGSLCGIAPPPVGACKISEASVDINYGDIDEVSLPNATESSSFTVTCNIQMDVLVIASGMDNGKVRLRDDGSLKANLFLNNTVPGQTGVSVRVPAGGGVKVGITSKLETNGRVKAGPFQGAGSLILTVP